MNQTNFSFIHSKAQLK